MTTQSTAAPRFRIALAERITTRQETLAAAARHLLDSPGKGLRPLCCRLVGAAFDPQGRTDERHEALAEAIELLHVGSLIHDDILDEAELRRGATAVHVRWNAKVAVLACDYLLARSTQLVAGLHDNELTVRLAQVVADLCEGELLHSGRSPGIRRPAASVVKTRSTRVGITTAFKGPIASSPTRPTSSFVASRRTSRLALASCAISPLASRPVRFGKPARWPR